MLFFFKDTATTEIYTLSLHDALPILTAAASTSTAGFSLVGERAHERRDLVGVAVVSRVRGAAHDLEPTLRRSEEHTSELQSRQYLVCRLLLAKKHIPRAVSIAMTAAT